MQCEVHQKKEMRQNKKGWYCPTPVRKSPDGKEVLEWCTWKPATQETEGLQSKALAQMQAQLTRIENTQNSIWTYLQKQGVNQIRKESLPDGF